MNPTAAPFVPPTSSCKDQQQHGGSQQQETPSTTPDNTSESPEPQQQNREDMSSNAHEHHDMSLETDNDDVSMGDTVEDTTGDWGDEMAVTQPASTSHGIMQTTTGVKPQSRLKSFVAAVKSNLEKHQKQQPGERPPNQLDRLIETAERAEQAMQQLLDKYYETIATNTTEENKAAALQTFSQCPLVRYHYDVAIGTLEQVKQLMSNQPQNSAGVPREDDKRRHMADSSPPPKSKRTHSRSRHEPRHSSRKTRHRSKERRPREHSRRRTNTSEPMEQGTGSYALTLTLKPGATIDPVKTLYDAIEADNKKRHNNIHIARVHQHETGAKIKFWVKEHAEKALRALERYAENGIKAIDQLQTSIQITAEESLQTEPITKDTYENLRFVKEGKIVTEKAIDVIAKWNPLWFASKQDIEHVEAQRLESKEGRCTYRIEIYTNAETIYKFTRASKNGRASIDLGGRTVDAWQAIREDVCHRCLKHGHWWKQCEAPHPNCRYCILKDHLSKDCPVKTMKDKHICFMCTDRNNKTRDVRRWKSTNHQAITTKCPLVRRRQRRQRVKTVNQCKRDNSQSD